MTVSSSDHEPQLAATAHAMAEALVRDGFAVSAGPLADPDRAKALATSVAGQAVRSAARDGGLTCVGSYRIPPAQSAPRPFQVLHLDFGIPVSPGPSADVVFYTALYVDPHVSTTTAATRLVPLRRLLSQRTWTRDALRPRLERYGSASGAATGEGAYTEGVLARIIEAASGEDAVLPPVTQAGFLCGLEFDSLEAEERFLRRHGLRLADAENRLLLEPGHLLIFSNLDHAHGRVGPRTPEELHQWMFGLAGCSREVQDLILSDFLDLFAADSSRREAAGARIG